jgi:hypothetical protein
MRSRDGVGEAVPRLADEAAYLSHAGPLTNFTA